MQQSKKTIIASSSGTNPDGGHIITPESLLSYVDDDDEKVYTSLATDSILYISNALWDHTIEDVELPTKRVFDFVPFHPALVRHWMKKIHTRPCALMFPRSHLDTESKDPAVRILKSSANPVVQVGAASMKADIVLQMFRRDVDTSPPTLKPYDANVWRPESYAKWVYMYMEFAPVLEDECGAKKSTKFPSNACHLLRCMMHTHFEDFGFVFGKLWFDFGLKDMVKDPNHFMQDMLLGMFMSYHASEDSPFMNLPPLFNAVSLGSGQRICAKCLKSRFGNSQMRRCPCHQVYYCSEECQGKDWKVHKVMCTKRKGQAGTEVRP
jgi:hypothetical protein